MEFKIDTKDSFTIIVPANGPIDAIMTDGLREKCAELAQAGSANYIIDLSACPQMDNSAVNGMVTLHEECYGNGQSLVFTGISRDGMNVLKETETDLLINVAPTMKEAIDIVSMEILERDLFNEES